MQLKRREKSLFALTRIHSLIIHSGQLSHTAVCVGFILHIIQFYLATDNRVFTASVMQLRRLKLHHGRCRLPRALDQTTTKKKFSLKIIGNEMLFCLLETYISFLVIFMTGS